MVDTILFLLKLAGLALLVVLSYALCLFIYFEADEIRCASYLQGPWLDDAFYSECLFDPHSDSCGGGVIQASRKEAMETIDTLVVYKGPQKDRTYRRYDLLNYPILMESKDKEVIRKILQLLQLESDGPRIGGPFRKEAYFFVFLDHTHMRRALMRAFVWQSGKLKYAVVQSNLNNFTHTTSQLAMLIDDIERSNADSTPVFRQVG